MLFELLNLTLTQRVLRGKGINYYVKSLCTRGTAGIWGYKNRGLISVCHRTLCNHDMCLFPILYSHSPSLNPIQLNSFFSIHVALLIWMSGERYCQSINKNAIHKMNKCKKKERKWQKTVNMFLLLLFMCMYLYECVSQGLSEGGHACSLVENTIILDFMKRKKVNLPSAATIKHVRWSTVKLWPVHPQSQHTL